MKPIIWPYKIGSESARLLAEALNCKRVRSDSTTFHPRISNLIINWGNSSPAHWGTPPMLNIAGDVATASNKLSAFRTFTPNDIRTVPWTTDKAVANQWLTEHDVYARTKLTGHSGDGIIIARAGTSELPNAPLYTQRVRGKYEYRIHVAGGNVIHVQQKRKREEFDGNRVDGIRNLANGYVFACNDIVQPSQDVIDQAIAAVNAIGLDFGAVDVIQYKDQGYVLEINSAPGIEGSTLTAYVNYFTNLLTS